MCLLFSGHMHGVCRYSCRLCDQNLYVDDLSLNVALNLYVCILIVFGVFCGMEVFLIVTIGS